MEHNSIVDYFLYNASEHGSQTAAQTKVNGAYKDVTWAEMAEDSKKIALGLVALGVNPGDRISVIANTCLEWILVDMGILWSGAVTVPIYPSNLPGECQYVVENSDAVIVFAEDADQVEKFVAERENLPGVKKLIQMRGEVSADKDWVMHWDEFCALGGEESVLDERRASLNKDSILTIIYTSGTTGRPKGVVTTHGAMLYEADAIKGLAMISTDDVELLFLPMAHSFAKVLEIAWLATRHVMAFAENMTTIKENLGEVRPTVMPGVPRIFEKFHAAVVTKGLSAGGLKAKLFQAALDLSEKNGMAEEAGKSLGFKDQLIFTILQKLVFAKISAGLKETMGGRITNLLSGGAPLSKKINWFFRDAGIDIYEGYGLTETSAATCVNRPGRNRIGTVGPAMPGTEIKIAEDGEILIKGPGLMAKYWKNPEATDDVLKNGWFHTGDIGLVESDGSVRITDRKKDIIVTAGGKNVAPQNIENLIKTHKLISQIVVHGDQRKFLSAVVTLDPDALQDFANANGLGNGSYAALTQKPQVLSAIQDAVEGFNGQLASYETIKKFKILEQDFSQETGELTPTLKVKRKFVNERYGEIFSSFYE